MRISDWSSDVCSSDLAEALRLQITGRVEHFLHARPALGAFVADDDDVAGADLTPQYAHHGGVLALIDARRAGERSEEHTSELQSLMRISYAVFCLKKKKQI